MKPLELLGHHATAEVVTYSIVNNKRPSLASKYAQQATLLHLSHALPCIVLGALVVAVASAGGAPIANAGDETSATEPVTDATLGDIDMRRLKEVANEPGVWLTPGRDAQRTYYSPLTQINTDTVKVLGFAWQFKTGSYRGLEATPIVADGVMYTAGNWGTVFALEAATGRLLWRFEPQTDRQVARYAGVDAVNRGVAVSRGSVFTVSLDCHVFALNARTGTRTWQTATAEGSQYTCSGSPTVAGRVLVIGNAGGDQGRGGVRGYVTALDPETGAVRWRFYTVPKVGEAHPTPEMKAAETTWDPTRDASFGGGGAVWDSLVYDADLNLVMFGTGNAAPYLSPRQLRGRPLDRLYAASIVALDADTGRMAWHYQTTPGDIWDFDATASLILADLSIDGHTRKTVMQANKNGYFYVLDRETGQPIAARPYSFVNWSSGLDKDFRPIVVPEADYSAPARVVYPSNVGAHSWPPMSFSPKTGLVYIPAIDAPAVLVNLQSQRGAILTAQDGSTGPATLIPDKDYNPGALSLIYGAGLPKVPKVNPASGRPVIRASLKAWDPIRMRPVWEQETSQDYLLTDGGAMSTGGNLVFAGREDGKFVAYAADTGRILKVLQTGTATMSAPMSYEVAGIQYIAVMQGHGGSNMGSFIGTAAMSRLNEDRILALKLGGAPDIPQPPRRTEEPYARPPKRVGTTAEVTHGQALFYTWCAKCHSLGVPAVTPDLSRLPGRVGNVDLFKAIVLNGALMADGMSRFDDVLSPADADALYAFLINEAQIRYQALQKTSAGH